LLRGTEEPVSWPDPTETWESARGPVAVDTMPEAWLDNAIQFIEKSGFPRHWFPALPKMRQRLRGLRGKEGPIPIEL
ncbi:hypothetical protein DF186_25770, partial [Enterococcus hirae]